MATLQKIRFVTPVAWLEMEAVTEFAAGMDQLIADIRTLARKEGLAWVIEKALLKVYSLESFPHHYENIEIIAEKVPAGERRERGMGHWWYSIVQEVFEADPELTGVVYYPVDTCWDQDQHNTVADPARLCGMIRALLDASEGDLPERLVLGNYDSLHPDKEWIEAEVRHILASATQTLPPEILRPRSEFWAVSRKMFADFQRTYFQNGRWPVISDPSLLLLIHCLNLNKAVRTCDLGFYRAEGDYPRAKMRGQIERARQLIRRYLQPFTFHKIDTLGKWFWIHSDQSLAKVNERMRVALTEDRRKQAGVTLVAGYPLPEALREEIGKLREVFEHLSGLPVQWRENAAAFHITVYGVIKPADFSKTPSWPLSPEQVQAITSVLHDALPPLLRVQGLVILGRGGIALRVSDCDLFRRIRRALSAEDSPFSAPAGGEAASKIMIGRLLPDLSPEGLKRLRRPVELLRNYQVGDLLADRLKLVCYQDEFLEQVDTPVAYEIGSA